MKAALLFSALVAERSAGFSTRPMQRAVVAAERKRAAPVQSAVADVPSASDSSLWDPSEEDYVMTSVERARTVAAACTSGTFCTSLMSQDGWPFGSHVDYTLDDKVILSEGVRPRFGLTRSSSKARATNHLCPRRGQSWRK